MSQNESEIGERIEAVIQFSTDNMRVSYSEAAEAIVAIIGYASYMVSMPIAIEPLILDWFSKTYSKDDAKYLDAISTIYANMSSDEALTSLKMSITDSNNTIVESLLGEAFNDFETRI